MEINIKNAFKVAVKLTLRPCGEKYRSLSEKIQIFSLQLLNYFLKRPILTTSLVSVFMVLLSIALAAAFIIIIGVLAFVIIILIIEGFIFIVFAVTFSVSLTSVVLIVMTFVVGIKYNLSFLKHLTDVE